MPLIVLLFAILIILTMIGWSMWYYLTENVREINLLGGRELIMINILAVFTIYLTLALFFPQSSVFDVMDKLFTIKI